MKEKLFIAYHAFLDKRTPWYVKAGLFLLIAYIISPIDLIPDFLPVLGLLDEVILIPIIFSLLYPLIPDEIKQAPLNQEMQMQPDKTFIAVGILMVLAFWLFVIVLMVYGLQILHV